LSVFVWSMVGIALWHFTIFVPDNFVGGIVGAFFAAWLGGVLSGFVLEGLAVSSDNPPGLKHTLYALPGSIVGLAWCYVAGARRMRTRGQANSSQSASRAASGNRSRS
jgi:hypothetical protein